jgi:hypothetical protein
MWRDRLQGDGVDTDDRSCHTERINVASVACNNKLKNYKCFGSLCVITFSSVNITIIWNDFFSWYIPVYEQIFRY